MVSEEVGGDVPRDWAAPFFLLDPLDGTKEFIRGSGDFTVNIALVVDHKPLLGAVYAPVSQRLQWVREPGDAVEETPPFTAEELGALRPLACRPADNAAITAALSRSHMNDATRAYIARYAVAHAIHARIVAQVLPARGGRSRPLPPPLADDGVGYRRRRRGADRGGRSHRRLQ